MTTTATSGVLRTDPPAPSRSGGRMPSGRHPGTWWREHRTLVLIAVGVLAALVLVSMLREQSATHGGALDPQNPSPDGARAVARVLAAHGVEVSVVRRAAELADEAVDRRTTVVVTSSEALGASTARRLRDRLADAGAVVLPAPGPTLSQALRLPVASADVGSSRAASTVPAACDDPLLSGLRLEVPPSNGYPSSDRVTACFTGPGSGSGAYILRRGTDRPTYLVAAASLLTNERVDRADNAAVALRLLGQHERLVWYVPDRRDVPVGDTGSLGAQLPRGLVPALWLVGAALAATILWRGRRFGALVVEPLPVVVKAVESTQGRGRLYRRVRDPGHAAAVLREATARRLATRVRLPAGSPVPVVADAAAAHLGADPRAVRDVLVDRPVVDDRALTRLAADLAALEKEVSHP